MSNWSTLRYYILLPYSVFQVDFLKMVLKTEWIHLKYFWSKSTIKIQYKLQLLKRKYLLTREIKDHLILHSRFRYVYAFMIKILFIIIRQLFKNTPQTDTFLSSTLQPIIKFSSVNVFLWSIFHIMMHQWLIKHIFLTGIPSFLLTFFFS